MWKIGLLALAVVALSPAPAVARTVDAPQIGTTVGRILTDRGIATYLGTDGMLHVIDDERSERLVALQLGCRPSAMRVPWLLLSCDGSYSVLDLGTGAVRRVPPQPEESTGSDGYPGYQRIGAQWVVGKTPGNGKGDPLLWVNWRDGRRMTTYQFPPGGNHFARDLDDPQLGSVPFSGCQAAAPERRWVSRGFPPPLVVRDCKKRRDVQVSACSPSCSTRALTQRGIAWIEPGELHVLGFQSLRTTAAAEAVPEYAAVGLTRRYAYFSAAFTPGPVWRLPIP